MKKIIPFTMAITLFTRNGSKIPTGNNNLQESLEW